MAHRRKHRVAAQVRRAAEGRKIKSDMVPGTRRTTDAYKRAKAQAAAEKKASARWPSKKATGGRGHTAIDHVIIDEGVLVSERSSSKTT